jgi:acetolactate synthase-1/2/3 large subunit
MAGRSGARVLADCLLAQGVDTAFGVPGESYLALLDALHDLSERIRLVPNRHEGGAAFMAEAWGKLTGAPGICLVTRGPGATNAAIGVHTAMQNSTPMVLLVGQVATGMKGREAFQEVDYRAAFGPIAKWATEIEHPDRIPEIVARAFAVAQSDRPGPVVVALPEDVLTAPTDVEPGRAVRVPQAGARPADLEEIRDRLEAANRPLVIAGGGGWSDAGRSALRGFAEANGLPVLVGFRNQDLLDNDSPSYAGDAGLGKTPAVRKLIAEADLILAVGVRFGEILTDGYTLFRVPHPEQGLIHAHASAGELNKIHTADLPIHAHPDALMTALATLRLPSSSRWEARTGEARAAWLASLATPPQPGALDMGEVMCCLQADLPGDAILTNGAGNFSIWLNKHFRFTGGQRLLGPQSGAMGYGLPAAIAAKVARPDACVVAFTGDGDFQMTMAELGCAMQARARPIVLVVNNDSYGTIRMHQERTYPGRVSFTDIDNPDFVAIAAAYGFHAERVTRTADFAAAFGRARGSATGALLELVVDIESLTPRQSLAAARASAGG